MCGSCGGRGKIVETEKQKQDFGYKHAQVERRCLDCKETGKRFKIYFKFPNGKRTMTENSPAPKTRERKPEEYAGTFQIIPELWRGEFRDWNIWFKT
jgi:hypothetical protein